MCFQFAICCNILSSRTYFYSACLAQFQILHRIAYTSLQYSPRPSLQRSRRACIPTAICPYILLNKNAVYSSIALSQILRHNARIFLRRYLPSMLNSFHHACFRFAICCNTYANRNVDYPSYTGSLQTLFRIARIFSCTC